MGLRWRPNLLLQPGNVDEFSWEHYTWGEHLQSGAQLRYPFGPVFEGTRRDPGCDLLEIFSIGWNLISGYLAHDGDIAFHQQHQTGRLGGNVVPARDTVSRAERCASASATRRFRFSGGLSGTLQPGQQSAAALNVNRLTAVSACRSASSKRSPTRCSISSAAALAAASRTARSPARRNSLTRSSDVATRSRSASAAVSVIWA